MIECLNDRLLDTSNDQIIEQHIWPKIPIIDDEMIITEKFIADGTSLSVIIYEISLTSEELPKSISKTSPHEMRRTWIAT